MLELLQTINETALGLRGRPGGNDAEMRWRQSLEPAGFVSQDRMSPRRVRGLFKKRRGREDVVRAGGSAGGRGGAKRRQKPEVEA